MYYSSKLCNSEKTYTGTDNEEQNVRESMIKLEAVSKIYNRGKVNEFYALKNASLEINAGELVAIVGKSGAGKSTLMHILGGIDTYEEAKYFLDGQDVGKFSDKKKSVMRNQMIGIVLQDFALLERYTVLENVLLPYSFSIKKINRKEQKKRAMKLLEELEIDDLYNKNVGKLSGGQKQRVAIARAMITEPSILLADEPTGALDEKTSQSIMDAMKMLNQKGITVIIVTHDSYIAEQCKRKIVIKDGCIYE